jgi:hypothetical protein
MSDERRRFPRTYPTLQSDRQLTMIAKRVANQTATSFIYQFSSSKIQFEGETEPSPAFLR